jgi:signal transduction histidine kinase
LWHRNPAFRLARVSLQEAPVSSNWFVHHLVESEVAHSPQLDKAPTAVGQPQQRNTGGTRSTDSVLDEQFKKKPQRRRGGFASRKRSARRQAPSLAIPLPASGERPAFDHSDLLPLLAHQLLTPLALIDTAAQRMARRAGDMEAEEIEARAGRIRAAAARLSTFAQALLSRTKLGTEAARVDLQACRIGELLTRASEHVQCFQPSRRLLVAAPQIEDVFWADPLLVEQAFLVLVCNAVKYSPEDTELEIAGRTADGFVALSVKDRGMGVPAADLPRIFDPFFRAQNASGYIGTGLGLNLADRIARLHGGWIDVHSREGRGSTFTIKLPVSSAAHRDVVALATSPQARNRPQRNRASPSHHGRTDGLRIPRS